jgi:hypothetical protein
MTASRISRRSMLALVIALVVVAAALIVAGRLAGRQSTTKLVRGGSNTYGFCWTASDGHDWSLLRQSGMEFGLDVVNLVPARGHVTVTKVDLIKPKGGLRLVTSVFAPTAAISIGEFGPRYGVPAYVKNYVRTVPATLERVSPAGAPAEFDGGKRWQLAVVVNVSSTTTDASATGVKLTYRSGSKTRTYKATDLIRVTNGQSAKCPS